MGYKNLWSTPIAAEYLGRSARTLIRWREAGMGPRHYKIRSRFYYRPSDLEKFMAEHFVQPKEFNS